MTWRLKLLSSLKLWMDQAIFFGIVSFFFNYAPEVGELPSCWWNVLPRFLHPVASCGEWKLAVGWGTIIAIIIPMPVILLDGRLASPATTWGASVQWRAFFYSLSKSGLHGFAPTMTAICKPPVSMGAMDAPGCWRQRSDNWSRAK